jgi:hypothetical protein
MMALSQTPRSGGVGRVLQRFQQDFQRLQEGPTAQGLRAGKRWGQVDHRHIPF